MTPDTDTAASTVTEVEDNNWLRTPRALTGAMLRTVGACPDQIDWFEKQWPNGVAPSSRQAPVIARVGLDTDYAVDHLIAPARRGHYHEACREAGRIFCEARQQAQHVRHNRRAYASTTREALRAYDEAKARAFIEAWRSQ